MIQKWTITNSRAITSNQNDALQVAYGDLDRDLAQTTYLGEKDKADALDQSMNNVYKAAQFILPRAGLTTVKKEQTEWLRKRDAASSLEKKCKLWRRRSKRFRIW